MPTLIENLILLRVIETFSEFESLCKS